MNKTNHNKVVIIGLDGATFSLILPWVKEGKLPVLAKLIQEGAWGNLKSTIPINTAPAWTSFLTGKNPGKHGIFDIRYYSGSNYGIRFANSLRRRGKTLWKILSDYDKEVCVFSVPITYPPEEVNGFMISGLTAPDVNEKIFYPRSLFKEVVSKVGMFAIKPSPVDHMKLNRFDRVPEEMDSVVDQKFKVARYLFHNKIWDFFCMVFDTTDTVQHFFWQHMDPNHPFHDPELGVLYGECIYKIYKRIDERLGYFIDRLDNNTTVFIMSDHGAGANRNRALYLNNWLAQEGFLTYKGNSGANTNKAGLLKEGILLAKKYIPRGYKNKIKSIFPWSRSKVMTLYRNLRIDWSLTRAFSHDNHGLIWVNLKGRESEGIVKEAQEYENLRSKIIERALDFTDSETGEKVFSEAFRREELYYGDALNLAPDIILVQKERQYMYPYRSSALSRTVLPIETFTIEGTKNDPVHMASHRINGIVIIKGPSVQCGKNITGARIIDIAPTVLYLMGIPIPEDMDGMVITEAIIPSHLNTNLISYSKVDKAISHVGEQAELTEREEKQVEESLRSLGYVD